MTDRSVIHSTFTLERTYDRPPDRVFAAWADPALKGQWFGDPSDDNPTTLDTDFRVGGYERDRVEPGTTPVYDARFHDIVPDERIVFMYDLNLGGALASVTLATVEFHAADGGRTRLTYTEQGAYLDDRDDPELRKNGVGGMLDELGGWLERQPATV
jgi:uncharacterized protein YndB with AHSA1/START domain